MAGLIPADGGTGTLGPRLFRWRQRRRVHDHGDRSILLHHDGPFHRLDQAPETVERIRTLQILENFLSVSGIAEPIATARRMLDRYGNLSRVLLANEDLTDGSEEEIAAIQTLRAARDVVGSAYIEAISNEPVEISSRVFRESLLASFAERDDEALVVFFLSEDAKLISREVIAHGDMGSVSIPIRRLVRRTLDLGANQVILAHNHPSGNCRPSCQDVALTGKLARLFQSIQVNLVDHLVVARDNIYSIKAERIL